MRNRLSVKAGVALLGMLFISAAMAAEPAKQEAAGKEIALTRSLGNCVACHAMPTVSGVEDPGDIGPPLVAMSARFPNKAALRAQIWDATVLHPNTVMPPFGKHKILTEKQIDEVTDFVYGL